MAHKEIPVYIYMVYDYDYSDASDFTLAWRPALKAYKQADDERCVCIGETGVVVEFPETFDPVPAQVAALQAQKLQALAKYTSTVAGIDAKLSRLQAITNEVA